MAEGNNSGGKNKKYGRNKAVCLTYRNAHKHEKNKARRMVRTFKANPRNHTLARTILVYDTDMPYFGIGADVRVACKRAIELAKERAQQCPRQS